MFVLLFIPVSLSQEEVRIPISKSVMIRDNFPDEPHYIPDLFYVGSYDGSLSGSLSSFVKSRALLTFNLEGIEAEKITNAQFVLDFDNQLGGDYVDTLVHTSNIQDLKISRITQEWDEPTWNNKPNYQYPTTSDPITDSDIEIDDITVLVQSLARGPNYGIMLEATVETIWNMKRFRTSGSYIRVTYGEGPAGQQVASAGVQTDGQTGSLSVGSQTDGDPNRPSNVPFGSTYYAGTQEWISSDQNIKWNSQGEVVLYTTFDGDQLNRNQGESESDFITRGGFVEPSAPLVDLSGQISPQGGGTTDVIVQSSTADVNVAGHDITYTDYAETDSSIAEVSVDGDIFHIRIQFKDDVAHALHRKLAVGPSVQNSGWADVVAEKENVLEDDVITDTWILMTSNEDAAVIDFDMGDYLSQIQGEYNGYFYIWSFSWDKAFKSWINDPIHTIPFTISPSS